MLRSEVERTLRCTNCSALELLCEPQGAAVDADEHLCASCLHARVKLEYGDLPMGYGFA